LVVDDNATNRLIVMKTLERHGCAVALASGGLEAIDLATAWARRGSPFDVVLLDVHMPGLDGIETARRLRAHVDLGAVPVILLSSIEAPMPALGRESGVVRALVKPVRQAALLQAVREALASARSSRDGAAPARAAAAT
jgi:CheY-like chemotaxis protein